MALFFQKGRGIIVSFFQKGRGMTVFFPQCYKFREHHRRSVGVLWAFGGFLQTRFYNNAAKIFSATIRDGTIISNTSSIAEPAR